MPDYASLTELRDATIATLTPPKRMTVSDWAEQNRFLSAEYSHTVGHYHGDQVPYAKEPMNACMEQEVRTVVLMWARQMTKTTTVENVIGYHIDCEPTPMLMVQPTLDAAEAYSKDRVAPLIRDTPVLQEKVSDAKSRESGNTISMKAFPGGTLAIVGANSPTGLGMRSRGKVFFDEVDRYPQSAGAEGDPITIATKTTETFPDSVVYITSTPTIKGISRVELEFEKSDKRKWFVKCPYCGHIQTLQWAYVIWPKGEPELAHIVCCDDKCGREWSDKQRVKAVKEGRWIATAPFKGVRGYFINAIYNTFKPKRGYRSRLHQYAQELIEAKAALKRGNKELMVAWVNCVLAETWEEQSEKHDPTVIQKRAESYSPDKLPVGALVVLGGADVQKDRIEVELQAVGMNEESWGIEVVKIYGDTEKPETWKRLSEFLAGKKLIREDGVDLRIAALGIDVHYRPTETRSWCKVHGTPVLVYPVLGSSQDQATVLSDRFSKIHNQRHWSLATAHIKDSLYARLKIEEPGPRYMHFPKGFGYDESWYEQFTCEKTVTRYVNGFPKRVYVKPENARNEAIDMRVYAFGAFEILKPTLPVIEKLLAAEAERKKKVGSKPTNPPPAAPKITIGGGFIGAEGFKIGGSGWSNS